MDPTDQLKSTNALIDEGAAAHTRGEYAREAEVWKVVAARDLDNLHWQSNLATALANSGEFAQAELLFLFAMAQPRPPSAAFNNYVVMHARRGAAISEMLPLLITSLEASETYPHFQRHLLNVAAAFALADRPIDKSIWDIVRDRSLAFLGRVNDRTPEHDRFVDECVLRFAQYEPLRASLGRQDWDGASAALDSIERSFSGWEYGALELDRVRHFRPLLRAAAQYFGLLRKLGSDSPYSPSELAQETDAVYLALQALGDYGHMFGSHTFLDLLGWSAAELHRQSNWLAQPLGEYGAEEHSTPNSYLMTLAGTAYSELAEMLQALLLNFNRSLRMASQRLTAARTPEERTEVLAHVWRSIRVATYGTVSEYRGLSEFLSREMLGWNTTPRERLRGDLERFRSFVESRAHADLFVNGKPQEHVARALLLAFLHDRGFSEVPMRGGRVDVLVVARDSSFVIELKIWRGQQYHLDGIAELQEYVAGDAVPNLGGAVYLVLDPTGGKKAAEHVQTAGAPQGIDILVVNINPTAPSRKGKAGRSSST